jgi:tRNA threonylcarbamoyl adenosine modification protein (Sua5/YciO/YrdC/YwlC family)
MAILPANRKPEPARKTKRKQTAALQIFFEVSNGIGLGYTDPSMKRLAIHPKNPQTRYLKSAAEVLEGGGLLVYPTDSVYGFGCDLFNKNAVEKIYHHKGNDKRKLLSFICPDLKGITEYAYVSDSAYKIMRRLLPGPYTFILNATKRVPRILLEKRKTVGIRVPDNIVCQALLQEFGRPIISTSAGIGDQEHLSDPEEIATTFAHIVDLFLDSGPGGMEPSTIIDLTESEPVLVRQGKGKL